LAGGAAAHGRCERSTAAGLRVPYEDVEIAIRLPANEYSNLNADQEKLRRLRRE
jgi:hypothetical protein